MLLILQWEEKSSIVYDTSEDVILIMENSYLVSLEEKGITVLSSVEQKHIEMFGLQDQINLY